MRSAISRVGRGRPGRDLPERPPYPLLERRSADVEGKVEAEGGCFHEADHPRHPGFELRVPAHELRPREAVFEVVHEGVRIVSEPDRAHPIRGRRDEDRAERAGTDREPDRLARASAPEHRRLHPEDSPGRPHRSGRSS